MWQNSAPGSTQVAHSHAPWLLRLWPNTPHSPPAQPGGVTRSKLQRRHVLSLASQLELSLRPWTKEVVKPGLLRILILFIQHNPFTLHNKVQTQQRLKCYKLQNSKQQIYSTDCTRKAKKSNVHVANVTRKTTVKSCGRGSVMTERDEGVWRCACEYTWTQEHLRELTWAGGP